MWRARMRKHSSLFIITALPVCRFGAPADQQRDRLRRTISVLDCRRNFPDIGIETDQVMSDAHAITDRFDDTHAVAWRGAGREIRLVAEQADHHADRLLVLDRNAADGIDRIEKARVLDQDQRAL